jgi:hypothetical protein
MKIFMQKNTKNNYRIIEGAQCVKSDSVSIFSCMNKEIENIIALPNKVPQLNVNIP